MPFSLRSLLGDEHGEHLERTIEAEPKWEALASWATAIGVAAVALGTFLVSYDSVDSPVLLGFLLTLVAGAFVAQCLFTISVRVLLLWCLVPLALLHLFGGALGLYEAVESNDQASLLILTWLVGQTTSLGRRRDIAVVLVGALAITIGRSFTDSNYGSAPIWTAAIGVAFLAGLFIRTLVVALAAGEVARAALHEQATTAERQRIAREVHDVIAHSLTVTMLHLTAARLAVGRGDSTAATEALEEAEKAGRTSLNEIRNTVGLLRTDGSEPNSTPLPAAADVPALVEGYRAAGLDVSLDLQGELHGVEPAAGLALYRIVQESLTNAGRHAPGAHTTVHIEIGPPLKVDVRTEGGPPSVERGTGMGLTGMAERTAALGGLFEAGQSGSGWRVAATLP